MMKDLYEKAVKIMMTAVEGKTLKQGKIILKDILNNNTENAIFTLDEKEYNLLNKLNKFQKIKKCD